MPVVDKDSRDMVKNMTKNDVLKAMEFFDKNIRRTFVDTRWRRWVHQMQRKTISAQRSSPLRHCRNVEYFL